MPPEAASDNAEVLKRCFLFQAVDEAGRRKLAERAHRKAYGAGENILIHGRVFA